MLSPYIASMVVTHPPPEQTVSGLKVVPSAPSNAACSAGHQDRFACEFKSHSACSNRPLWSIKRLCRSESLAATDQAIKQTMILHLEVLLLPTRFQAPYKWQPRRGCVFGSALLRKPSERLPFAGYDAEGRAQRVFRLLRPRRTCCT